MAVLNEHQLIAPCGINCGVCYAYLREKNKCPGCRGEDDDKPVTRVRCGIKTCDVFHREKMEFCFHCADFPCAVLKHLDKRYREKYKTSVIANLDSIRDYGIGPFLQAEKVKWTCADCGGAICVHKGYCCKCGRYSGSGSRY